jgi:hypothetical protein
MLARSFNLTFDAYRFEYKIIERVANEERAYNFFFFGMANYFAKFAR